MSRHNPRTSAGNRLSARDEVAALIANDPGHVATIYRLQAERPELTRKDAANHLKLPLGTIYRCEKWATAALTGNGSGTDRKKLLGFLRALARRGEDVLTHEAMSLLEWNIKQIRRSGSALDPEAETIREALNERAAVLRQLRGVTGIYVFTYAFYLNKLTDRVQGRTFFKVGRSVDVAGRMAEFESGSNANVPEPLWPVRVYSAGPDELPRIERSFHLLLKEAGHSNPVKGPGVGSEWFNTSVRFLDGIAQVMSLKRVFEKEWTPTLSSWENGTESTLAGV